ncbi:hypothetical protein BJS_08849 [Bradyrhizobium japonicum SEMIA 5079]|nr:hypothetical protein BJS_08849 [Bradyrhizobium japonicum SEMIA 5079]
MLAGLPPQVGVYGYMLGGIGYALPGSSRQLAIGPTSAISLMIAGTVGAHAQLRDLLRADGLAEKSDSGQWLRSLDSVLGGDSANTAQRTVDAPYCDARGIVLSVRPIRMRATVDLDQWSDRPRTHDPASPLPMGSGGPHVQRSQARAEAHRSVLFRARQPGRRLA